MAGALHNPNGITLNSNNPFEQVKAVFKTDLQLQWPDNYSQLAAKAAAEPLERIFDKFVQSTKTNTGSGGTGLGLTVAYAIIQEHERLPTPDLRHEERLNLPLLFEEGTQGWWVEATLNTGWSTAWTCRMHQAGPVRCFK